MRCGWGLSQPEQSDSRTHPHPSPPPQAGEGAQRRCGAASLIALGERIRLDEIGGLVDQLVLTVRLRLADAGLRPEVMVLVDADVAFGRALELHAGRGRRD